MIDPNGCRLCGIDQRSHAIQATAGGTHTWERPTQEQIKARMTARRAGALTDDSAEAWEEDWDDSPQLGGMGEELRQEYGDLFTGPLAGLADPVADWLDEAATRPEAPEVALRVAQAVNAGVGKPCICTEDAWPPHCPRHGIDS